MGNRKTRQGRMVLNVRNASTQAAVAELNARAARSERKRKRAYKPNAANGAVVRHAVAASRGGAA